MRWKTPLALVAILALLAMHDICVAEVDAQPQDAKQQDVAEMQYYHDDDGYYHGQNSKGDRESLDEYIKTHPSVPTSQCVCPPGFGGSPCGECVAGTYSAGGAGATCTPCGAGLTSPVGSTSSTACLSAACASQGYKAISIPADGTPITDSVTPPSCYTLTLDATTEGCFAGDALDTVTNPAGAYYIAAAPLARNITVTNCITMSHDPATVQYAVDTGIIAYESNADCEIASDALLCADDWNTTVQEQGWDYTAIEPICADGDSEYAAFTFVQLAANKDYLIVNNYYDDMAGLCSDNPVITTALITTFSLNGAQNSLFGLGGTRTARPIRLFRGSKAVTRQATHQGKTAKRVKVKKGL